MAQHDYVIANGTGAAVRSDLNNGLSAIVSQNSGATAPATTYAYMTWADTTAGVMKMRNGANNAWITLYQLDGEWSTIAFENGSAAAPSIYFKDSGTDTGIYSPGTDQVAISTGGTGRLFIDASGRLLAGTSTARTNFFGTTLSSLTQIEGTGGSNARGSISVLNNDVSNNPPYVLLGRSGAATLGSNAAVVSGSRLGTVSFHGADGTSFIEAATVAGEVDGTPGSNDMPGRLVFSTTADGAASPTERLRITSAGLVGVGTSAPSHTCDISGSLCVDGFSDSSTNYITLRRGFAPRVAGGSGFTTEDHSGSAADGLGCWGHDGIRFSTAQQERLRITAAGNVGIGVTGPQKVLHVSTPGSTNDGAIQLGGSTYYGVIEHDASSSGANIYTVATASGGGHIFKRGSTEQMRIDASSRLLVGTSTPVDSTNSAKTYVYQSDTEAAVIVCGTLNNQGTSQKNTIVRQYSAVSLGTKLIIPFQSQGNKYSTTICKIWGHSARFNSNAPLGFEITFTVGHLTNLANLGSWGGQGNYASIAINGMNVEITFTTAYTSTTANGIFACIEYMTNAAQNSIIPASITMN
jgi:hypothetical protein